MRVHSLVANTLLAAAVAATGCAGRMAYNLPPAQRLMHPGPGVDGPGPGVIPVGNQMMGPGMPAQYGPGGTPPIQYGARPCSYEGEATQYCEGGSCPTGGGCYGGAGGGMASGPSSQIQFVGEEGLTINWDVNSPGMFDSAALFVPNRQDFAQGAIYRLKVSNIPGRAGVTLYPTLEVAPVTARTDAFLAHAAVPVQFTEEDFDQVLSGNFVTKVIYLPDPEFQELALSGVETLVSTRLDPGVDPVAEADRRGSILAILRMGSKDLNNQGGGYQENVIPAAYGSGCDNCGPNGSGAPATSFSGPAQGFSGPMPGASGGPNMPMGMPTSGFAPTPVPPHMIAGAPQWGMPYTGTPIGLPGPPHIPLGSPAGLRKHTMKNRTRMHLPPPTNAVSISVKQRPGQNYPNPVTHVHVDETTRAPFNPLHGTVKPGTGLRTAAQGAAVYGNGDQYCE